MGCAHDLRPAHFGSEWKVSKGPSIPPLGIVVVELIPKPELDTKILFKMKTEKLWLVIEMPSPPLFTAIAPTM